MNAELGKNKITLVYPRPQKCFFEDVADFHLSPLWAWLCDSLCFLSHPNFASEFVLRKAATKKGENCFYSKNGFYVHNLVYFENLKTITAVVSCVQKTEWGGRKKSHTISYRK